MTLMLNNDTQYKRQHGDNSLLILPALYFFGRLVLAITLPIDSLTGFGDIETYSAWANQLGWVYLDSWSEYPPVYPFLNKFIFLLSGDQILFFVFLLVIVFSFAGALSLYLHSRISRDLYGPKAGFAHDLIYFGLIIALPYTWWYFDMIPVLLMLVALWAAINRRLTGGGIAIGLGILTKWFPIFLLVPVWRLLPWRKAFHVTMISLGLTVLTFGALFALSPEMTKASLSAQVGRNSYETVWALIDNNYTTGAVFVVAEQTELANASFRRGNLPVISPWFTLGVFGLFGLISILKIKTGEDERNMIAVLGMTWMFFLLWCPGWSPQWILYLIPLFTLSFKWNKALFLGSLLILLTGMEWPLFLTRHLFFALWIIVPLRMAIMIYSIYSWRNMLIESERSAPESDFLQFR